MQTKNKNIHFRISEKDFKTISDKAKMKGLTKTDFIVQSAMQSNIMIIGKDELKQFASELRNVGIKLNQITKLCNMGKIESVDLEETNTVLNNVGKQLRELRMKVRKVNEQGGGNNETHT